MIESTHVTWGISASLELKPILYIPLYFSILLGRPDLKIGLLYEIFQLDGKIPVLNE